MWYAYSDGAQSVCVIVLGLSVRHLARDTKKKTRNVSIAAFGLVETSAPVRDGVTDLRSSYGKFIYKYPKKVQRVPKGAAVGTMDVVYSNKNFN